MSPPSRLMSWLFMRILAVRKREGGKIPKIFFRPCIAKFYIFFSRRDVVEDHGCQKQAFFDWEL